MQNKSSKGKKKKNRKNEKIKKMRKMKNTHVHSIIVYATQTLLHHTQRQDRTGQDSTMGKTVIVTGASQGLGKCIALNILENYTDSNVVIIGRNKTLLQELENTLGESYKDRFLIIVGDVTDSKTVADTISETLLKFGSIDGIVFNAGIIEPIGHLNDGDYDVGKMKELFDVNFFSIVEFLNQVLPDIERRRCKINLIFVSSGASKRGINGWLAYGSSKAAVNLLCKQIHDEMKEWVSCVSVAPGVVDTDMQRRIRDEFKDKMSEDGHDRFVQLFAKGELVDPMVVGKTYCRLAVEGVPSAVQGEYVRWNDPGVAECGK